MSDQPSSQPHPPLLHRRLRRVRTSCAKRSNAHPELEVVGSSEHVAQAAGVLAGGHLDCILHATRAETFPRTRGRRDPRADPRADHRRRAGEATEILDEALEADVADVLLLPQLIENVVFTVRKAAHAKRAVPDRRRVRNSAAWSRCSRRRAAPARR